MDAVDAIAEAMLDAPIALADQPAGAEASSGEAESRAAALTP
jgi:hypothetical protein